jgi:hypothetical protein
MSEERNGLQTADATATAPAKTRRVFNLGDDHFNIALPVSWANKDGFIKVIHRFKRPTQQQEAEYNRRAVYQERISTNGKISDQQSDAGAAKLWLWDGIAESISGYPGLEDQTPVTPEIAVKMRSTHKDLAIEALFECDAEVLPEESVATFDDAVWMVRLKLGNPEYPYLTLRLRMREWTEKERTRFEKSNGISSSEQQGKTRLTKTAVNQAAHVELFNALLVSVDVEEGGSWDKVTVNGGTFAEQGPEAFAAAFLGEWKMEVTSALTRLWRKKRQDSMTS